MDKSTLRVHQIELVIDAREDLSNGRGVADHATSSHNLCQIATRNNCWWLVINTAFESSWTPIHKLDGPLGLDGCNSRVNILRDNIPTVHHAAGHIFAVSWIAFHKHGSWLKYAHR